MRRLILTLTLLCISTSAFAQFRIDYIQETLTVSTTAVPFTAATYTPAGTGANQLPTLATFVVEGCAIRVWTTSATPTATVGQKLAIGDVVAIAGTANIVRFRAIRDTSCGADATLSVVYSR